MSYSQASRLFVLLVSLISTADAAPFTAEVYQLGGDLKTPLFRLERVEEGQPERLKAVAKFTSPDGKVVVVEESVAENGALKFYKQEHFQLGESGTVEVKDGKIHFAYARGGKIETATEDATPNLIASPNTMDFLEKHWAKIKAGETIPVRFAVPDRRETVGFKFFKTGEFEKDGKKYVNVRMKASSIVIAALIDPVEFVIEKDKVILQEVRGRTIPKLRRGDRWKDLDAHIFYHFK